MWTREQARAWAAGFRELVARARERGADADADIVDEVSAAIELASDGVEWPPTRRRVLSWAHLLAAVGSHLIESEAGLDEDAATLIGVAKGLQRVAPGLHGTGEVPAIAAPAEVDESADTIPIMRLPRK